MTDDLNIAGVPVILDESIPAGEIHIRAITVPGDQLGPTVPLPARALDVIIEEVWTLKGRIKTLEAERDRAEQYLAAAQEEIRLMQSPSRHLVNEVLAERGHKERYRKERDDLRSQVTTVCGPIITLLDIMDERARVYAVPLPEDDDTALDCRAGGGLRLSITWGELRAIRRVVREERP